MKQNHSIIFFSIFTITSYVCALDNPHFYRASNMFLEPQIEHDHLTIFNASVGGGTTHKARNSRNEIVPLFNIYGKNIIPDLDPNKMPLCLDGTFKIIEANLSLSHNLIKGFFLLFHLPVRSLTLNNISLTNFPLQTFNTFLAGYGINTEPTTTNGIGDLASLVGWTHNYQETKTLDFIDFSCMTGFLAPTGKVRNENKLFSLPTGYNGHWGIPLYGMVSIGFYEWITLGATVNAIFFIDKDHTIRLKTDTNQSGFVKLTCGDVSIHQGSLINTGIYLKADHFGHGFSFTTAYSFASQKSSHLCAKNPTVFNQNIINADPMIKDWNMHTFNFFLEYDFAQEESNANNRIGFFYNLEIAGKRTFNTNMSCGTYGLDIRWNI